MKEIVRASPLGDRYAAVAVEIENREKGRQIEACRALHPAGNGARGSPWPVLPRSQRPARKP